MVRKRYTKKQIFLGILTTIFILCILTFHIWNQIQYIQHGYRKSRLEQELQRLKKEVEELEAKKSSLLSLERVERIAREELKLVQPEKSQIRYEIFGFESEKNSDEPLSK